MDSSPDDMSFTSHSVLITNCLEGNDPLVFALSCKLFFGGMPSPVFVFYNPVFESSGNLVLERDYYPVFVSGTLMLVLRF